MIFRKDSEKKGKKHPFLQENTKNAKFYSPFLKNPCFSILMKERLIIRFLLTCSGNIYQRQPHTERERVEEEIALNYTIFCNEIQYIA